MDVITADDDYEIVAFRRDPVYDEFMRAIPMENSTATIRQKR
jgi:hypothetical protein